MKKLLIYIYSSPQVDNIRLIESMASGGDGMKIVHFSRYDLADKHPELWTIFQNRLFFLEALREFWKIITRGCGRWMFFEILPFRRFEFISKANLRLKFFLIRWLGFLLKRKIFILYNFPDESVLFFVKNMKNATVIGDCTEYWPKILHEKATGLSDHLLVNSLVAKNNFAKKYQPQLISPGYFSRDLVVKIFKKNKLQKRFSKTVLYLGSIDWRMDFNLVAYAMKKMSDYTFFFLSDELFNYDRNHQSREMVRRNQIAQKKYKIIKSFDNFRLVKTKNHAAVLRNISIYSVGLLPYVLDKKFYQQVNPVKLYFYLAAGIPVVSSALDIIGSDFSLIETYQGKDEFVQKIKNLSVRKISPAERMWMIDFCLKQTIVQKAKDLQTYLK